MHTETKYSKTELLLLMIRQQSERRSSLCNCKYMEGMCLDRKHIVLTQSSQTGSTLHTHQMLRQAASQCTWTSFMRLLWQYQCSFRVVAVTVGIYINVYRTLWQAYDGSAAIAAAAAAVVVVVVVVVVTFLVLVVIAVAVVIVVMRYFR
jgi:hypothetical protein